MAIDDATAKKLPSGAWADFRNYLTGQKSTGRDLPDKRLAILNHGKRLPQVLVSDLWRRRT